MYLLKDKRQVNEQFRKGLYKKAEETRVGITRHIMMHQVLYIVELPNEEGDMHIM